ncbi:hypothetical protein F4820DRAFT_430257 [Hypoxylon rubiginosum]|uniref:Uncharacterized protein n=1 Tax=Hypoxylon rubiginosum TaxID=110542 RepID=A0ACB9YSX1_9PEZI|nr:hypothetical protein F4820DRAFT_430257 [Hypoxylon rubiginosum]
MVTLIPKIPYLRTVPRCCLLLLLSWFTPPAVLVQVANPWPTGSCHAAKLFGEIVKIIKNRAWDLIAAWPCTLRPVPFTSTWIQWSTYLSDNSRSLPDMCSVDVNHCA